MDGYKKGYLGHQSTTSAASYQFSAADHYSDTMICLWGFLLLAVATSSVDSQCAGNMAPQSAALKRELQIQSSMITNLPLISNLNFGTGTVTSLISGVLGTVSALTGLKLQSVNVTSTEIQNTTTGYVIIAGMTIAVSCKQIPSLEIKLSVNADVYLVAQNGSLQWRNNTINIALTINNSSTQLSSAALDAIQKALLTTLTGPVENMLSLALTSLNHKYEDVKAVFTIGNMACRYYITGVTQQGMIAVVNLTTYFNGQPFQWGNYEKANLTGNQTCLWTFGSNIISAAIESALSPFKTTIIIAKELLANISWLTPNGSVYILLNGANVMNTNVTVNGVNLNLTIPYSLFSNSKNVSNGILTVILRGQPQYDDGSFGINFTDLSIITVSIEALWVNKMGADCTCGGGDTIRVSLINIIRANTNFLIAQFNSILGIFFGLPRPLGLVGPKGECKAEQDRCTCTV